MPTGKKRIIFIDDEAAQDQIKLYCKTLVEHGFVIAPTTEYLANENNYTCLVDGVFTNVDAVCRYIDNIIQIPFEWNKIDGFIIDSLMPKGSSLPKMFEDLRDGGLNNGTHNHTGIYLVFYLNNLLIENRKNDNEYCTKKVLLLSNLVGILEEFIATAKRLGINIACREGYVEFIESGLQVRYFHKKGANVLSFSTRFHNWLNGAAWPRDTNADQEVSRIFEKQQALIYAIKGKGFEMSSELEHRIQRLADAEKLDALIQNIKRYTSIRDVEEDIA